MDGPTLPSKPVILPFYRALSCLIAALNLGLAWLGGWLIQSRAEIAAWIRDPSSVTTWAAYGWFCIVAGLIFGVLAIAVLFLPRTPWAYVAHLTNIVAATLTCVLAPLAVPVLVFWFRQDTRDYFQFK
jgi:hypothetical protein